MAARKTGRTRRPNGAAARVVAAGTAGERAAWAAQLDSLLPLIRARVNRQAGFANTPACHPEDITQEVLAAVWQTLPRFDPSRGVPLGAWLVRRIDGAIQDAKRRAYVLGGSARSKREEKILSLTTLAHQNDRGDWESHDPAERHAPADRQRVEDRDHVERLLKICKPAHAQVLRLYFLEGLTMRETGRALGLSESRISQIIPGLLALLRRSGVQERCA